MSKYSSFAHSCIGESHIKKGTVCQDSSLCVSNSRYTFAASADGHGSACYLRTDIGSEYAVDCAQSCVDEFLRNLGEAQETGIASLKIGYNNVFGYYLEVRNTYKDKVPQEWVRKQTLAQADRKSTRLNSSHL